MPFLYIIGDGRNLTADEQQKTKIRCGKIDPASVFQHLYGRRADTTEVIATQVAIDSVLPQLTRCQQDLLTAEFGSEETTISRLEPTVSDTLFDYPLDSNMRKLEFALDQIRSQLNSCQ